MSSDLEKYLQEQRAALDVESPDDKAIWEGIREGIHKSELRSGRRRIWIRIRNVAALVLILLGVGYISLDLVFEHRSNKMLTLADLDQELGSREKEYRSLVNQKFIEAGTYTHAGNLVIVELLEEIQKLDTIYDQTLKDLDELGYNEQVIQTIFDTYEKKIFLLELIILENNKIKNYESTQDLFL